MIGLAGRPDDELTARVDGAAIGKDETIFDELVDVLDVGGEEDIEGRAVFDLLRQLRGGAQAGDDVDFVLTFEGAAEIRQNVGEVCGRGHVEFRRLGEAACYTEPGNRQTRLSPHVPDVRVGSMALPFLV